VTKTCPSARDYTPIEPDIDWEKREPFTDWADPGEPVLIAEIVALTQGRTPRAHGLWGLSCLRGCDPQGGDDRVAERREDVGNEAQWFPEVGVRIREMKSLSPGKEPCS